KDAFHFRSINRNWPPSRYAIAKHPASALGRAVVYGGLPRFQSSVSLKTPGRMMSGLAYDPFTTSSSKNRTFFSGSHSAGRDCADGAYSCALTRRMTSAAATTALGPSPAAEQGNAGPACHAANPTAPPAARILTKPPSSQSPSYPHLASMADAPARRLA